MYTLKFFDDKGEREEIVVSTHSTVEDAFNGAFEYGATKFYWDSCLWAGQDTITFGKVPGTLCVVNQEHFNGMFV